MKMKMRHLAILLAGIALTATACMKETGSSYNAQQQYNTDTKLIEDYLTQNNINALQDDSTGIYYTIDSMGTGTPCMIGDTILVNYSASLLNGTVVSQSDSATTILGFSSYVNLINSWPYILPRINAGGGVTIYSQSYYALQNESAQNIPPNSVIVFHIKLLAVNPDSSQP